MRIAGRRQVGTLGGQTMWHAPGLCLAVFFEDAYAVTMVPMGSPMSAWRMVSGSFMEKTTMGMLFS
jgi:hypothetical protein